LAEQLESLTTDGQRRMLKGHIGNLLRSIKNPREQELAVESVLARSNSHMNININQKPVGVQKKRRMKTAKTRKMYREVKKFEKLISGNQQYKATEVTLSHRFHENYAKMSEPKQSLVSASVEYLTFAPHINSPIGNLAAGNAPLGVNSTRV
jgi:hypothetical protein